MPRAAQDWPSLDVPPQAQQQAQADGLGCMFRRLLIDCLSPCLQMLPTTDWPEAHGIYCICVYVYIYSSLYCHYGCFGPPPCGLWPISGRQYLLLWAEGEIDRRKPMSDCRNVQPRPFAYGGTSTVISNPGPAEPQQHHFRWRGIHIFCHDSGHVTSSIMQIISNGFLPKSRSLPHHHRCVLCLLVSSGQQCLFGAHQCWNPSLPVRH